MLTTTATLAGAGVATFGVTAGVVILAGAGLYYGYSYYTSSVAAKAAKAVEVAKDAKAAKDAALDAIATERFLKHGIQEVLERIVVMCSEEHYKAKAVGNKELADHYEFTAAILQNVLAEFEPKPDASFRGQLNFQTPATEIMEKIVDLHHDLMFFIIVILVFVS